MSAIALFCCAYILGLLCSPQIWSSLLLSGSLAGLSLLPRQKWFPQQWRQTLPNTRQLLIAALIGLLAAGYMQIRIPQPGFKDISRLVSTDQGSLPAQVTGTIASRPALTRRDSVQIWLNVQQARLEPHLDEQRQQQVTGKLYVTVPRKAAKDLYPSQSVTVTGQLYRPAAVTRPHGYDFKAYLAREGAFAGFQGKDVRINSRGSTWGGWAIRARIVRSLVKGTDARTGALLSALVLGKDAADIAYDLKDDFIQAGLAHALAASGFQVSLILSAVLTVGRSLSTSRQVALGLAALLFYGLLSGAEPSIVRAILMGCAYLAALGLQRKTLPVALLLAVAVVMLLYNPLWVWDLGFQLSMLATLGLIVTVPPLTEILDWLPTTLGSLVAVPLAATIWTLPLQLYTFGILPLYSLIANVLTAFLLSVLTIGGLIASCGALLWPLLGSGLAWVLFWPIQLLIAIVSGISHLPGHALALGSISLWQLLALYGCMGAVWIWGKAQWKLIAAVGLLILVVPLWQIQNQRFLITVFDKTRTPMMVIEHPRSTVLVNSGDRLSATQSLVPFLQQEGINRIDWAIATDSAVPEQTGWTALLSRIPITNLSRCIPQVEQGRSSPQSVQQTNVIPREPMTLGSLQIVLWRAQPTILEMNLGSQRWLLVDGSNETDFSAWLTTVHLPSIQTLWWTSSSLSTRVVEQIRPQTLILSGKQLAPNVLSALKTIVPQVFWTGQDGTIQWTPKGFSTTVNPGDNNLMPL
jgi:competence protein ComEC